VLLDLGPPDPASLAHALVLEECHDVTAPQASLAPALLHRGSLGDQEHAAVGRLQDEERSLPELVRRRARHAPAEAHSGLEAHQLAHRRGVGDPQIASRQALLDVAQELHLAERRAVVEGQAPGLGARAGRQPRTLQELQPGDQLEPMLRRPLGRRNRVLEGDQPPGAHALLEHRVELAETPDFERPLPGPDTVGLRAVAERLGGQLSTARADAVLHVLAVQEERPSGLVPAADGHVDVRVGRVLVVDRHPFEPRPEIPLHRVQDAAGVVDQVEGLAPLGGQDHFPQPRILGPLPAFEAPVDLHRASRGVEPKPLLPLALGSLAGEVAAVGAPAPGRLVGHVLELHHAPLLAGARPIARPLERPARGARACLAVPDPRRDLAQEQTASLAALGPDAAGPDAARALGGIVTIPLHALPKHGVNRSRRETCTHVSNVAAHASRRNPGLKCAERRRKTYTTSGRFILALRVPLRVLPLIDALNHLVPLRVPLRVLPLIDALNHLVPLLEKRRERPRCSRPSVHSRGQTRTGSLAGATFRAQRCPSVPLPCSALATGGVSG
jgi:hypothetical protein